MAPPSSAQGAQLCGQSPRYVDLSVGQKGPRILPFSRLILYGGAGYRRMKCCCSPRCVSTHIESLPVRSALGAAVRIEESGLRARAPLATRARGQERWGR
jgi:hypothetical protein